jgi:hypothetical protein
VRRELGVGQHEARHLDHQVRRRRRGQQRAQAGLVGHAEHQRAGLGRGDDVDDLQQAGGVDRRVGTLGEHRHVRRDRRTLHVEQRARAEHDLVEDGMI